MSLSASVNLRAKVVQTLLMVQQGKSLSQILHQQLLQIENKDRALFHEILLGTLRQWFSLKNLALPLLNKELNNPTVEACLYVGLYQVLCTRIALHASISETVDACKQLGFEGLSGVVNAILRKASRDVESFQEQLSQSHGLPSWLYKRLKKDWGELSEDLFQQLKQNAPLTLRVNQQQKTRNDYLKLLEQQNIDAELGQVAQQSIVLKQNVVVTHLPGFDEGWCMVQDEHAQLCAEILPNLDGKIVIDACAAPGGKTTHLLEKFQIQQLIALDNDEQRLAKVDENLKRLQLQDKKVQLLVADATQWQANELVDCIVLDAPCSATGVIRRHPDIRLLRQSQDILQVVDLQKQILENMWKQLKKGGVMLYITCSILKAENEQQMDTFFTAHSDAVEIPIQANWGIKQKYGRQLLPKQAEGDGFYYCLIQKI